MKKFFLYTLSFTIQQVLFAQDASEAVGKTISDIRMNGLVNYKATEFKGIFPAILVEPLILIYSHGSRQISLPLGTFRR